MDEEQAREIVRQGLERAYPDEIISFTGTGVRHYELPGSRTNPVPCEVWTFPVRIGERGSEGHVFIAPGMVAPFEFESPTSLTPIYFPPLAESD